MGATLATLRKYVRAEVNDPAPERLPDSSTTFTHDGGDNLAYFEDNAQNFYTTHGVRVGDVIINVTDGNSIAVIQQITNGGGASPTNARLVVGSIEGGTDNDYDDGDVIQIWNRHAQNGLDANRWTDTEVNDALTQAQKLVAIRFGGVEKFSVKEDIKVMHKCDLVGQSGTFSAAETVTGGTNNHAATVEYVGDDFIIIRDFITRVPIDGVSGTFKVGETVTGATNSYTGIIEEVNGAYLDLYAVTGEFDDDEVITGGTTAAYASVNSASSYSSASFAANETITGGTSTATGILKSASSANNFYVGQDLPTDLKNLIWARWWDGSQWHYLRRDSIEELTVRSKTSGDPLTYTFFDDKIWLWPQVSIKQYNEIHLFYMAWDNALSADTTTTTFDLIYERLLVLEAAKILAGGANEEGLYGRIMADIQMINNDIEGTMESESRNVGQMIDWDFPCNPFLE